MFTAYRAPSESNGSGTVSATCVLCQTSVSPKDMAIIECGMLPESHKNSIHVSCGERYATNEANKFLKSGRLSAICPNLAGGGASANLVSNTLLKALGLQDMLDLTSANKTKSSASSLNGKMAEKYLKRAKEWANDKSTAKKLLLAACPHEAGCGLTIESYKAPQENDSRVEAQGRPVAAPPKVMAAAADVSDEDADNDRCVGMKSDGTQCPRSANELGGDIGAKLCRRCKGNADQIAARAAAAAAQSVKRTKGGATDTKRTAKPKLGGMSALLKSAAKPVATCQSCATEYFAERGGVCPTTGEKLCNKCMQPILDAAAALASEAKKIAESAASAQSTQPAAVASSVKGGLSVYKQTLTMPSAKYPKINFAGRIIGKGGEDIRKLKAETGCYINVEDPFVYIESKLPECVDDAVKRITTILDAAAQYAEELEYRYGNVADTDTYADESLGWGGGGGGGSLSHGTSNAVSSSSLETDTADGHSQDNAEFISFGFEPEMHAAVPLPSEAKKIPESAASAQSTRPVLVASSFKGGQSVYKQTLTMPSAKYPKINFAGRIIGKGGEDIRKLKAETGCYIIIEGPFVHIESKSLDCVDDAVARITTILDAAAQYAEELDIRYGNVKDTDTYADESVGSGGGGGSLSNGTSKALASDSTDADPVDRKSHAKAGFSSTDVDYSSRQRDAAKLTIKPGSRSASEPETYMSPPPGVFAATKGGTRNELPVEADQAAAVNARLAPDDECAICIESLIGGSTSTLLCGHTFHSTCVKKIKEYNSLTSTASVCPLCQQTIKSPSIEPQEPVPVTNFTLDYAKGNNGADDDSSSGWQVKPTKEMRQADVLRKRQSAALQGTQEVPAATTNAPIVRAPAAAEIVPAAAAVEVVAPNSAAAAEAPARPAVPEATPELARLLSEAGPTIGLLRDGGVSDATLQQLVEANLTTKEQIMAVHDDGLSNVGIKKGPRIRILRILSPLTLESEDEGVKDLLERFRLGKYRARCADEQIDVEALTFFTEEPDEALSKDLGIKPEDFQTFREAIGHAKV